MKTRFIMLLAALVLLAWTCCEQSPNEGYCLTFKVDMSDVEIADTDTVGIRGSIAPLSWTETYLMDGPDENGIYSIRIPFDNVKYGERLQYKYILSDTVWDNDRYGERGNRVAAICCSEQLLPVDEWNVLESFALESLLHSSQWDFVTNQIYMVAKAKERGQEIEEIAQEFVDFWEWTPQAENPEDETLVFEEFFQAKSIFGNFEILSKEPGKIEYTKVKDWEIMMYMWNEDGTMKGLTASEMTEFHRRISELYLNKIGWEMTWQDEDDHKVRITMTK